MKTSKSILFLFLLMLNSIALWAQQAEIAFAETKHNFGEIEESAGPVSHTFQFKNTGKTPLILYAVNASCGCTTPTWTRKPVAPGQTGSIKVTYNPLNRPGAFSKSITVNSNASKTETIHITGHVLQKEKELSEQYPRELGELRAKSNYIRLGKVKNTELKKGSLELINASNKPQHIDFRTPPEYLSVSVIPETVQPGEKALVLVEFDGRKCDNFGEMVSRLYLLVDGKASYRSSIGVSASVEEDFSTLSKEELANAPLLSFDSMSYDFGEIKQNDKVSHTFQMTNKGHSNLIIRKVNTSCGCTAVAPQKSVIAPGETVPLVVKFDSKGKLGRQTKTITILTNAPASQSVMLRISTSIIK